MIKHCVLHGGYIVCLSRDEVRRINNLAQEMGVKIACPITYDEAINHCYDGQGVKSFHIDNAERFLQHFFNDVEIKSISINGNWSPSVSIKKELAKYNVPRGIKKRLLKGEWADIDQ